MTKGPFTPDTVLYAKWKKINMIRIMAVEDNAYYNITWIIMKAVIKFVILFKDIIFCVLAGILK